MVTRTANPNLLFFVVVIFVLKDGIIVHLFEVPIAGLPNSYQAKLTCMHRGTSSRHTTLHTDTISKMVYATWHSSSAMCKSIPNALRNHEQCATNQMAIKLEKIDMQIMLIQIMQSMQCQFMQTMQYQINANVNNPKGRKGKGREI